MPHHAVPRGERARLEATAGSEKQLTCSLQFSAYTWLNFLMLFSSNASRTVMVWPRKVRDTFSKYSIWRRAVTRSSGRGDPSSVRKTGSSPTASSSPPAPGPPGTPVLWLAVPPKLRPPLKPVEALSRLRVERKEAPRPVEPVVAAMAELARWAIVCACVRPGLHAAHTVFTETAGLHVSRHNKKEALRYQCLFHYVMTVGSAAEGAGVRACVCLWLVYSCQPRLKCLNLTSVVPKLSARRGCAATATACSRALS